MTIEWHRDSPNINRKAPVGRVAPIAKGVSRMGNTRFDYYQGIRNIHPDLFWSLKFQQNMRQEQKQMGNAFYQQLEMPLMETAV